MNIVGEWTIFFDWGCTGNYIEDTIVFTGDGNFEVPSEGSKGKWVQVDDMILWQYDSFKTSYAGNMGTNMMSGIMAFYAENKGRWHAVKSTEIVKAKEGKPKFGASGNKLTYK